MVRGLFGGFVSGAALSACAASVAFFLAGPPIPPEVGVDVPVADEAPDDFRQHSGPLPRRGEGPALQPATPVVTKPEAESEAAIADDTTRPGSRPQPGAAASNVREPVPAGETGSVAIDGVAPVRPNEPAAAPMAPAADSQADMAMEAPRAPGSDFGAPAARLSGQSGLQMPEMEGPGTPVAPDADTAITGLSRMPAVPGAPAQPDRAGRAADPADTAPRPEADAAGPQETQATAGPREMSESPARAEPPVTPAIESRAGEGRAGDGRAGAPGLDVALAPEDLPSTGDPAPATAPVSRQSAAGDTSALPQAGQSEPSLRDRTAPPIGTPATSLLDRNPGSEDIPADPATDPRATDPQATDPRAIDPRATDPQATDPRAIDLPATDPQATEPPGAAPTGARPDALSRNAETFANPEAKPLMSIILMDTGQDLDNGPVGLAALGSFPHPLSFAVDISLPDAAARAEEYRSSGHEVLAMVDLPENLTAADTEVALTAMLARLPQAVAVLEGTGSGLQGNGQMLNQVTAILEETGHGIVWQPGGLDTADRLADRSGVASHKVLRDFDDDGQTPMVIRRSLDNAAFRTGQEGPVIMVGRVRPDTISALLLWSIQDRAQRVALAPVSAVLLAEREGS